MGFMGNLLEQEGVMTKQCFGATNLRMARRPQQDNGSPINWGNEALGQCASRDEREKEYMCENSLKRNYGGLDGEGGDR